MGSLGARLGICLAIVVFGVGCQPLYGGKPEKLATPVRKKPPKEEPVAEAPVKMIDDCTADFRADPRTARQNTSQSNDLTSQGDTALSNADKSTDPSAQAGLYKESIDRYRNALIKDPYNPTATLKLALAYDKVYRKGCAIAMLKRLATLAANPKFSRVAGAEIDSIGDNGGWFKHYRKDALAAVGR
jgi:hypothetical protein